MKSVVLAFTLFGIVIISGCLSSGQSDIIQSSGSSIEADPIAMANISSNFANWNAAGNEVDPVAMANISENFAQWSLDTTGGGSLNATTCNPANEASTFNGNWQGFGVDGFDCINVADDDSSYLTSEQDPIAMANISSNIALWSSLGRNGTDGINGTNGTNGINGTNGTNSINVTTVPYANITGVPCFNCSVPFGNITGYSDDDSAYLPATITNPLLDQFIMWNGANWINMNMTMPASGGQGVQLFFNNTQAGEGYESLKTYPDSNSEQDETTVVNNNISQSFEKYKSDALGGSQIDGGEWYFDIYTYVSQNVGTTELLFNVSKRNTTDNSTALLFSISTGDIDYTVINGMNSISTVQSSFAINSTDIMIVNVSAKTDSILDTTVHFVHSGTAHYSHIHTPLTTRHNDLAGLQGGASGEYYHMTSAEYGRIATWDTVTGKTTLATVNTSAFLAGTAQVTGLDTALSGKEPTITASTNNVFWNGLKAWITIGIGNITGLQGVLDGLNTTDTNLAGVNTLQNTALTNLQSNDTVDRSYVNTTFITKTNATTCSGTDKSVWNGTAFTCQTDQTGAGTGTPFAQFNYTSNVVNTTSNTVYTNIITLPLTTGKKVIGECSLLQDSNAAATGIPLWINLTGTSSQNVSITYPGTATSFVLQSGTTNKTNVVATGSGGTSYAETTIRWQSVQSSGGTLSISQKVEASVVGWVRTEAGSYCRSIEI